MPETQNQGDVDLAVEQPAQPATTVQNSVALGIAGERVEISDSVVGAAAAGEMSADDSLILIGAVGSLRGNAQVVMDSSAAFLFGAGLAFVLVIAGRLLGGRGEEAE